MAVGVAAEVKSKLNVVDIVGETVALRKAGQSFKGLCPFHGEKTPSFTVTPARESWHCFGCGLGGDIFSFVMQRDSIGFPEALKRLAARAGVELDERTARDDARKSRLREVLESAITFYHAVLFHRVGEPALAYLRGRGFTDETLKAHLVGWAPAGWDVMSRQLQSKRGIGPHELAEVGLTTPRASGRGAYDRFRARITFPIRDANGAPTGLGGRILPGAEGAVPGAGDGGPKYLNSPATPLFDKSRTLYLLDRAKSAIRRSGQAVLVEGYTDALMAHQAGFENVVASLGTALTPGQVALISRYGTKIALAYDVDPAGQRAGSFGVSELSALIGEIEAGGTGLNLTDVGVVKLPEGRDPDEVVRENPDLWREAVRTPQQIVAYLIDYHASRVDLRTPDGRKRALDAVIPTLRRVRDPILRDGYVGEFARRSGVEEHVILEALRQAGRPTSMRPDSPDARLTADAVRSAPDAFDADALLRSINSTEAELLHVLLVAPEEQERIEDRLGPDDLPSTPARELYRTMRAARDANRAAGGSGRFERGRFLDMLDPESRGLAIALLSRSIDRGGLEQGLARQAVDQCLLTLERDRLDEAMAWTRGELVEAEHANDREAIARLMDQERTYNETRRSLDRRIQQASLLARPTPDVELVLP